MEKEKRNENSELVIDTPQITNEAELRAYLLDSTRVDGVLLNDIVFTGNIEPLVIKGKKRLNGSKHVLNFDKASFKEYLFERQFVDTQGLPDVDISNIGLLISNNLKSIEDMKKHLIFKDSLRGKEKIRFIDSDIAIKHEIEFEMQLGGDRTGLRLGLSKTANVKVELINCRFQVIASGKVQNISGTFAVRVDDDVLLDRTNPVFKGQLALAFNGDTTRHEMNYFVPMYCGEKFYTDDDVFIAVMFKNGGTVRLSNSVIRNDPTRNMFKRGNVTIRYTVAKISNTGEDTTLDLRSLYFNYNGTNIEHWYDNINYNIEASEVAGPHDASALAKNVRFYGTEHLMLNMDRFKLEGKALPSISDYSKYKWIQYFRTDKQLKTKQTYLDKGYDFVNIWSIDPKINDGYAYFIVTIQPQIKGRIMVATPFGNVNIPYYDVADGGLNALLVSTPEGIKEIRLVDVLDKKASPVRISTPSGIKSLSM